MKWEVGRNPPPRAGMKVFLDGKEVRRVVAFDTELGWVVSHCLDGHTGHPGELHIDPDHPDQVCRIFQQGDVHVEIPTEGGFRMTFPTTASPQREALNAACAAIRDLWP